MARTMNNREKVLLVVLGVAAIIAWRQMTGDGIGFGGAEGQEEKEERNFGRPPVVRMDLLEQNGVRFDPRGRDLFAYYVPPPPPKKYKPPPPPPPRSEKPQRPIPAPPPPPPPRAPVAPAPTFKYLGYFGPKDSKIAAFEDDKGVFLASVGEVVEKQFRLTEFKHDSVMFAYTDLKWEGRTTELKLVGLR